MPDTTALRAMESAHTAWLLVLEGVGAWTNSEDLAGVADYFGDGRPLWSGLTAPSWEMGIDVLDARIDDFRTTFEIQDRRDFEGGGYLASLFRGWDPSEEQLEETLPASDVATAVVQVLGRHVGTEHIGPAGQRQRWPHLPGWTIGDQHLGLDVENAELPAATVSEVPLVFRGRRVALFRVYRDVVTYPEDPTQGWRPWDEAVKRWWGTLEDHGTVDGSVWSLSARGPDSYVAGQLGSLSQTEGVPVSLPVQLRENERAVAIRLRSWISSGTQAAPDFDHHYGESIDFSEQLAASYTDPQDLAFAVASIVDSYAAAVGADGVFEEQFGQSVRFGLDGVGIRIGDNLGPNRYGGLELVMHQRVWEQLGWDPATQDYVDNPAGLPIEELPGSYSLDTALGYPVTSVTPTAPPSTGYWVMLFTTAGHLKFSGESSITFDNQGVERFYRPLYTQGAAVIPADLQGGLVVQLDPIGGGQVRHTGQLDRPPAPDPADPDQPFPIGGAVTVDRQGVWMLVGPRATEFGDSEDEVQFVVASWQESSTFPGTVGPGIDPEIVITRWLDPRRFGVDRVPIPETGRDWAILQNDGENQVRAFPVFRLGVVEHGYSDRAEEVILRVLHTTGASTGWTGYEGDPTATIDTTPNEPVLTVGTFDAEVRDLGLAIPQQLVAPASEWRAQFARLPDGGYRNFNLIARPGLEVSELFEGLFRFYGLMWSLRGGRYGVTTLLDRFGPEDVDVILTQSSKAPRRGSVARTQQELRAFQPIDTFEVEYQFDPEAEKFRRKQTIRANDRGARYRADGYTYKAEVRGIRSTNGWLKRRSEIARFWERRHFMLRRWPVLSRIVGEQVWPGSIVQVTEPRGVSQDGTYRIDAQIGIVVRVREDGSSKSMELDILVQADQSRPFYVMAPSASAYGWDSDTNEILVYDNYLGLPTEGWSDAVGFVEPDWSTVGGDLDVKGLQWDGQQLNEQWTGTVIGVTTTPGAARIQLSTPPVGGYMRDQPCLVVPREYDNQTAAWALAYFAVIGDADGTFGAGGNSTPWMF